jgi:hypothetical protein
VLCISLIKRLQQPGVETTKLFWRRPQATGNNQTPFFYGSIPGEEEFFFRVQ